MSVCMYLFIYLFIHSFILVYDSLCFLILKALAPIPESEEEALSVEEGEEEEQRQGEEEDKIAPKEGNEVNESPSINPTKSPITQNQNLEIPPDVHSKGWEAIPKPKGHSGLDYSRWDRVEDDSSEEEDDEDEQQQPQYRFRVRTVGVRPVKWKCHGDNINMKLIDLNTAQNGLNMNYDELTLE